MAYVYFNPGYANLWDSSGDNMQESTTTRAGSIFKRCFMKNKDNWSLKAIPESNEYWAQFGMSVPYVNNPIGLAVENGNKDTLIGCSFAKLGSDNVLNLYCYIFSNISSYRSGKNISVLNINDTEKVVGITVHAKTSTDGGNDGVFQVFVNGIILYDSGPIATDATKINRVCVGSYRAVHWVAVASHDITQDVFCPMTVAKSDVNGFTENDGTFVGTGTGNTLKQKLTWPDTLKNASIQAVITDFPTAYYGASDTISPVETFIDDGQTQKETGLFTDIAKVNTGALMGPFLEKNPITGGVWKKEDFDNTLFGVKVK